MSSSGAVTKLLSNAEVASRLGGRSVSGVNLLRKNDPDFDAIFLRVSPKRVVAEALALERYIGVKKLATLAGRRTSNASGYMEAAKALLASKGAHSWTPEDQATLGDLLDAAERGSGSSMVGATAPPHEQQFTASGRRPARPSCGSPADDAVSLVEVDTCLDQLRLLDSASVVVARAGRLFEEAGE